MITPDDLTALEALLAKATPQPWRLEKEFAAGNGGELMVWAGPQNDAEAVFVGHTGWVGDSVAEANSDALVAAINALPSILAELRQLRAERERAPEEPSVLADECLWCDASVDPRDDPFSFVCGKCRLDVARAASAARCELAYTREELERVAFDSVERLQDRRVFFRTIAVAVAKHVGARVFDE